MFEHAAIKVMLLNMYFFNLPACLLFLQAKFASQQRNQITYKNNVRFALSSPHYARNLLANKFYLPSSPS